MRLLPKFPRAHVGALALPAILSLLSAGPRAEDCDGNGVDDAQEIAAVGPVLLQGVTLRLDAPLESPVLAEADGDGALDLLAIAGGEIVLHSGRGGKFPGPALRSGVGAESILAAADLEPDGDTDLAVALDSGLLFLLNDGRGSFSAGPSIATGQFSGGAFLDLDSDGRLDLVSIRRLRSGEPPEVAAILLEAGIPRVAQAVREVPDAIDLVAVDIDGDSDLDLAVASTQTLALHENAGGLLVRKRALPFKTTSLERRLETARIHANGDDVVIHSSHETYLLLGGGGWDQELRDLDTFGGFRRIGFADFDRDGLDDLIEQRHGELFLARNTGSSSFLGFPSRACLPVSTGRSVARRILDSDLDGNGTPDVLLDFETDLSVFFGIPEGDTDGNGRLDACDPDCNQDGLPDAAEIARVDCNGNGFPDACDPDCDADGVPDDCAIATRKAEDCDGNSIPDACEPRLLRREGGCLPGPDAADDCDGNGVHDADGVRPRVALWPLALQRGELADLDGDGDVDLLGALDSWHLQFSRNHGNGVFSPEWKTLLSSGLRTSSGDIDGDGDLDWISSADVGWPCNTSGTVLTYVFLGDGNGSYWKRFVEDLAGCALVNLDEDGLADLAGFDGGKLHVLLGRGDGTFERTSSLPLQGTRVATADIDGDGDQDLCTELGQILLNVGAARLGVGALLPPGLPEFGDFDGNGLLDVASPAGVRLQFPGGRFQAYLEFTPSLLAVESGDLDGDGRTDLISLPEAGQSYRIHWNTGAGLSDPSEHGIRFDVDGIASADVNGDSFPELLLDLEKSDVRMAFRNDGRGGFDSTLVSPSGEVEHLAVGDMDADGDQDIVSLEYDPATSSSNLRVVSNRGAGRLASGNPFPLGHPAGNLLVSELTGDGLPDALAVGDGELWLIGNEGGLFPEVWQATGHLRDVLLADADGDGRTDIVAPPHIHGNRNGGAFVTRDFLPRQSILSCVFDADGDSDLDLLARDQREVALLLNDGAGTFSGVRPIDVAFSMASAAAGDWDGDGDADLALSGFFDPVFSEDPSLVFHWNDGSGTFLRGSSFPRAHYDLSSVDLDGDGRHEVLGDRGSGYLRLDRRGRLESWIWQLPDHYFAFALGDLQGDRALELIVPIRSVPGPTSLLVLESSLSASPDDLDLDGTTDACAAAGFLRGDWNGDLILGITDAIALLDHLFRGGEISACLEAGDADDSGALDLTDAVRVLLHLFLGGEPLPAPFPSCGLDPTPELGCGSSPCP